MWSSSSELELGASVVVGVPVGTNEIVGSGEGALVTVEMGMLALETTPQLDLDVVVPKNGTWE